MRCLKPCRLRPPCARAQFRLLAVPQQQWAQQRGDAGHAAVSDAGTETAATWQDAGAAVLSETVLRKLPPGATVAVRVRARSEAGASEWSVPATATTRAPAAQPPAQPAAPRLSDAEHVLAPSWLEVCWDAADGSGLPVTGYVLECDSGSGWQRVYVGDGLCHRVRGLQPGALHRFRVSAASAAGSSAASAPLLLRTARAPEAAQVSAPSAQPAPTAAGTVESELRTHTPEGPRGGAEAVGRASVDGSRRAKDALRMRAKPRVQWRMVATYCSIAAVVLAMLWLLVDEYVLSRR